MKKIGSTLGILSLFFLQVSCVSSSKHEESVKSYEDKLKTQSATIKNQKESLVQKDTEIKDCSDKLVTSSKDKGQLKSNLNELKKALDEMRVRREQEQKTIKDFRDLTSKFKTLTDAGTLSVRIVEGKMVVSLGSDILFPSGSAHLSGPGLSTIAEVGTQLASIKGKKFQIEGHTDSVPIKTPAYASNWELASARALAVLKTMVEAGLEAKQLSAASYGDTQPVATNDNVEGKTKNRRIEIVVVPDLSTLPGFDELKRISNPSTETP